MLDRGDGLNSKASLKGRGRDILELAKEMSGDNETMSYSFEGNLDVINQNENRSEITKAMKDLETDLDFIRPSDVAKYYGVTSNSNDGRRMARTMQRMADQFELHRGSNQSVLKV
jgi:hypothetical protein